MRANQRTSELKNVLEKKRLTPSDIIERYQTTGQRTILFDCAETGKGLASLLYFLTTSFSIDSNQQELLEDALALCVYFPVRSIGTTRFLVNGYGFWNLADSDIKFGPSDNLILKELANTDENRLTAHNNIADYKKLESDFDNNINIKSVVSKINTSIQTLLF